MRVVVCALLAAASVAAQAAEPKFHRAPGVKLLGYDPERSIADQCETRANTARILRVALTKTAPAAERVATHLLVAGHIGAARAICAADKAPEALAPFVASKAALDQATCEATGNVTVGKINDTINDLQLNAHPDIAAGFVAAVAVRAAGLAYLKNKPLVALAGSRTFCSDELGRAFELSNYQLTQTMIEALP